MRDYLIIVTGMSFGVFIGCFISVIVLISRKRKHREAIITLLSKDNQYLCDDCLTDMCEISKREEVIEICSKNHQIRKNTDIKCSRCGNLKLTRSIHS